MKLNQSFYHLHPGRFLVIISLFYVFVNFYTFNFILTDEFYYATLSGELGYYRVTEIISLNNRFQWLTYVFTPLFVFLKIVVVAAVLYLGLFLGNSTLKFKDVYKISLVAEVVPLVGLMLKFIYLTITQPESAQEVQNFYPLSLVQLFGDNELPSYLVYPVQMINAFEILYWIVLAMGLQSMLKKKFSSSLLMVAATYGVALFVWTSLVVFIQVTYS